MAGRRARDRLRSAVHKPGQTARRAGIPPRCAHDLPIPRVRRSRWADELWSEHSEHGTSSRHLHRPHPQGRQARRLAGAAVHQGRVDHQPQDRQGARPRNAGHAARPRRRGYRMIRRREFITLLGGALVAWPLAARAQQGERIRRIGALIGFAETDSYGQASANAFRQGLEQLGWVEGRNIRVDHRFAAGDPALYKTYAAELVGLRPDVILAGATPAVAVLQPTTRTIPIVL